MRHERSLSASSTIKVAAEKYSNPPPSKCLRVYSVWEMQINAGLFNDANNGNIVVEEQDLFNIVLFDGMDEKLSMSIEQIYISKASLRRLMTNLSILSRNDCSSEQYGDLIEFYEEFLLRRSNKFSTLKTEAEYLLRISESDRNHKSLFSSDILSKLEVVKYDLNK